MRSCGRHQYYHIKTDKNNVLSSSYMITDYADSCDTNTISFKYFDGTPIAYTEVLFFGDDNCILTHGYSNHFGNMALDKDIMIRSKRMRINSLGATGEIATCFKLGCSYHCRCAIPYPFMPITTSVKITIINDSNYIILRYKKKKIKMRAQPFEEKGDSLFLSFFSSLM